MLQHQHNVMNCSNLCSKLKHWYSN